MPEELDDIQEIFDEAEFDPDTESFYTRRTLHSSTIYNDQQRGIFDTLKEHNIDNDEGGLYNFDAPGGSGKTFLANVILAYVRKDDKVALAMALSGIAATLLKLGTTFHRRFGVPIPCLSDSSSRIGLNSKQAKLIREAKIIIKMKFQ